jgi:hypothetical protein
MTAPGLRTLTCPAAVNATAGLVLVASGSTLIGGVWDQNLSVRPQLRFTPAGGVSEARLLVLAAGAETAHHDVLLQTVAGPVGVVFDDVSSRGDALAVTSKSLEEWKAASAACEALEAAGLLSWVARVAFGSDSRGWGWPGRADVSLTVETTDGDGIRERAIEALTGAVGDYPEEDTSGHHWRVGNVLLRLVFP